MTLRLDLGSGPKAPPGWTGVDRLSGDGVIPFDFASSEPWPFLSESVHALRSSHLIEHLPARTTFAGKDLLIRFFEEAWRVAEPGACFELRWPCPFHPQTGLPVPSAWWDPTHYRIIPHQQIWSYFSADGRRAMGVESYGILCNWTSDDPVTVHPLTEDGAVLEYRMLLRRSPL